MTNLPLVQLRDEYYEAALIKARNSFKQRMQRRPPSHGGQDRIPESKIIEEIRRGCWGEAAFRQHLWYPPPPPLEDYRRHDVGPFDVKTAPIYNYRDGRIVGGDMLIPLSRLNGKRRELLALVHQLPGFSDRGYVITGYVEWSAVRRLGIPDPGRRRGGECLFIPQHRLHDMPDHPVWRLETPPWQEQHQPNEPSRPGETGATRPPS